MKNNDLIVGRTAHGTPIKEIRPIDPRKFNGRTIPQVEALCGFKVRGWVWVVMDADKVLPVKVNNRVKREIKPLPDYEGQGNLF